MSELGLDVSLLKKVKQKGDKIVCQCPACHAAGEDETGNHLVIYPGGKFGCATHQEDNAHRKEIYAMVGTKPEKQEQNGRNQTTLERTHRYNNAQGDHVFDVLISRSPNGKKAVRQRRADGSWSVPSSARVLYRLPELLSSGGPVWIVEGEKDVETLEARGITATCNPMGAGKWTDAYSERLLGRDVILVPDNDKPGREHVEMVARSLDGVAASVRVVNWSAAWREMPEKADITDALENGITLDDIEAVAEQWKPGKEQDTLREKLSVRRFDFSIRPKNPPPVISLGGHSISTAGNITAIQAKAKAGKTAGVSGIIGAVCREDGGGRDCLGFEAENRGGKAVIHFDTEQSRFDADALIRRSLYRAGVDTAPSWLSSFAVADLDIAERRKALSLVMEDEAQSHGGIHLVIIDGIADLCEALNDDVKAFDLVHEIYALAIRFECPILTLLHENPGSEIGKTRGHLGSELERKAETNLRFVKDGDGVTTMYSELSRNCHIPKSEGFCFRWSEELKMHQSCGRAAEINEKAELAKQKREAELVFKGTENGAIELSYSEAANCTKLALGLEIRSAKGRIAKWKASDTIKKGVNGKLELVGAEVQNGAK